MVKMPPKRKVSPHVFVICNIFLTTASKATDCRLETVPIVPMVQAGFRKNANIPSSSLRSSPFSWVSLRNYLTASKRVNRLYKTTLDNILSILAVIQVFLMPPGASPIESTLVIFLHYPSHALYYSHPSYRTSPQNFIWAPCRSLIVLLHTVHFYNKY